MATYVCPSCYKTRYLPFGATAIPRTCIECATAGRTPLPPIPFPPPERSERAVDHSTAQRNENEPPVSEIVENSGTLGSELDRFHYYRHFRGGVLITLLLGMVILIVLLDTLHVRPKFLNNPFLSLPVTFLLGIAVLVVWHVCKSLFFGELIVYEHGFRQVSLFFDVTILDRDVRGFRFVPTAYYDSTVSFFQPMKYVPPEHVGDDFRLQILARVDNRRRTIWFYGRHSPKLREALQSRLAFIIAQNLLEGVAEGKSVRIHDHAVLERSGIRVDAKHYFVRPRQELVPYRHLHVVMPGPKCRLTGFEIRESLTLTIKSWNFWPHCVLLMHIVERPVRLAYGLEMVPTDKTQDPDNSTNAATNAASRTLADSGGKSEQELQLLIREHETANQQLPEQSVPHDQNRNEDYRRAAQKESVNESIRRHRMMQHSVLLGLGALVVSPFTFFLAAVLFQKGKIVAAFLFGAVGLVTAVQSFWCSVVAISLLLRMDNQLVRIYGIFLKSSDRAN